MSRADPTPSPSKAPPHPPPIHKRTYQACIPCRERKVRCDLGSVEAPSDPPCVRCRRESKECFFSATRRKTRTPTEEPTSGRGRGALRRKHQGEQQPDGPVKRPRSIIESSPVLIDPLLAAALDEEHAAAVSDGTIGGGDGDGDDGGVTAADALLRTHAYNSHEALLTLIEAAGKDTPLSLGGPKSGGSLGSDTEGDGEGGEQESHHHHHHSQPQHHHHHPHHHLQSPIRSGGGVRFSSMTTEGNGNDVAGGSSFASSHAHRRNSTTSPGMAPARSLSISTGTVHEAEGMEKALRVWNKFRFVKAGWFTAREAIDYVEYFYKHLHPLSPTLTSPSLQHISHPAHHPSLLRQEPFLTTIILLITSRYMTLSGPGGLSRSYVIHDMLWREVRGGCEGLMWGGGWGGVGTPGSTRGGLGTSASSNAKVARGLRTLGTIEGLLILTEWHVRGLHFPMDVEGGDWMVDGSDTEGDNPPANRVRREGGAKAGVVEGLSDQIKNILEPAYRSDRMSWMLLGNALALAYELGVFDEIDEPVTSTPSTTLPNLPRDGTADAGYRLRFQRVRRLLLVYVLQLASRLGWTSMIPRHITNAVRHKLSSQSTSPTSSILPPPGRHFSSQDDLQDVVFQTWVDLTMLMKSSAEALFPSRRETKSIMRSGRYVALLNYFQPLLSDWKREFEALCLPAPIYFILTMEYEHVRFYVNSLALQAVVDRCTSAAHAPNSNQSSNNASASTSTNNPPRQLLNQVNTSDLLFIKEVVDASRALLSCVVDKMAPPGYLKHAPVRIYLRILGAAMFLLKTFALGAKEEDVNASLSLIHRSIAAMREAAVDDVHLALRFADLLETLTRRIKTRVVRMAAEQDVLGTVGEEEREREARAREREEEFDAYEDWLALPVDPITGAGFGGGVGVTQSQMGVDVGGVDLLELLLAGEGE